MKNTIEQIAAILANSERDLQQVIAEAAKAGDYRGVDAARSAAANVHEFRTRVVDSSSSPRAKLQTESRHGSTRRARKASPRKRGKSGYPKFEVRNGTLVRTGWSKKQSHEYAHKVPKAIFDRTVKAMAALAKSGTGPFMAEQIIEQVDHLGLESIPSYQVYVVLGFLRHGNVIKQIGREGYRLPEDLTERARSL